MSDPKRPISDPEPGPLPPDPEPIPQKEPPLPEGTRDPAPGPDQAPAEFPGREPDSNEPVEAI